MKNAISRMLAAIKVECMDEFDRNFDTESFFGRAWQRRKSPINSKYKTLHGPQATLRRSLVASVVGGGVEFRTDLPYAALHNQGGEIKVTERMKRYFWYQHIRASGGMGRKKNGQLRHTQKNQQLSTEANFWKAMALMKVGTVIKIPQRQFLGWSEQLGKTVEEIIDRELDKVDFKL